MPAPLLRTSIVVFSALATPLAAQSLVTSPVSSVPVWTRIGDVTGDGRDDEMFVVNGVLEVVDSSTGSPLPFLARPASDPSGYSGLTYTGIGDYDGDGKDDLVYWDHGSMANPNNTAIVVSGADGSTMRTLQGQLVFQSTNYFPVRGGDFDGDGRSDLFLVWNGVAQVLSARTGAPLAQWAPSGTETLFSLQTIGDEDGDGCDDAQLHYVNGSVGMKLIRAPGVIVPIGYVGAFGDVTGDGRVDVIVNGWITAGGTLTQLWQPPGAFLYGGLGVGDLDGDGCGDFVVGQWMPPHLLLAAYSGATFTVMPGGAPLIYSAPIGDTDGDGRSECVAGNARIRWVDPTLPVASRMVRRGVPGTTNDGRKPTIVTRGSCALGRTAFFDLRGGLPNGLTLLVYGNSLSVDLAPIGAPGNTCYTDLAGAFAFVANGNGVAQYQATMPVSPVLLGATLSLQAVVVDPLANALGLVTSSAIDVQTNN